MKYLRNTWKLLTLVRPDISTLTCLGISLLNIIIGVFDLTNPAPWISAIWCAGCGLYIHLKRALNSL